VLASITEVSSALEAVDSDLVGVVGLGKIGSKLDEVIAYNNLSESTFKPVKDTIARIKNQTEAAGKALEAATTGAVDKLNVVSSDLGDSKGSINEIKRSLDGLKTNIDSVTGTSAETVVDPLKTHITPVVAEKTHLSFLFPTLIVLVVMLIAILLSSGLVVREKNSTAFFRNFITPTKDGIFILGHFLTNFLILSLQLTIIFVIASIFFKGALTDVLWKVALALVLIVSVFILIGMFIGYLFRSEETAMLGTVSVASIFLFFSSTILPLETLPGSLKKIADFNPFVLSEAVLKKIMLFKVSLASVSDPLLILAGYILLLGVLVYGVQKLSKGRVQ